MGQAIMRQTTVTTLHEAFLLRQCGFSKGGLNIHWKLDKKDESHKNC